MCALDDCGDGLHESDEDLLRRVRLSVERSRLHGLRLIDIEVNGDTVVLSGEVVTLHQKQLATALVRRVAGVVKVVNRLEVQNSRQEDGLGCTSHVCEHSPVDATGERRVS